MLSTSRIRSKNVCIQSIDDIHPDYTLIDGDIVEFKSEIFNIDCKYAVCPTHLNLISVCGSRSSADHSTACFTNSYIFDKLKINSYKFCENYYGYKPNETGQWPEVHFGDYRALTRVVKGLYSAIDGMGGDAKFVEKTSINSVNRLTVPDSCTSKAFSGLNVKNCFNAISGLTLNDGNIVITTDTGDSKKIEIDGAAWYKSADGSNSFQNMFQSLPSYTNNQSNDIEYSNDELEKDNNGGHVKLKPIKSNIKHVNCDKEIKIKF